MGNFIFFIDGLTVVNFNIGFATAKLSERLVFKSLQRSEFTVLMNVPTVQYVKVFCQFSHNWVPFGTEGNPSSLVPDGGVSAKFKTGVLH